VAEKTLASRESVVRAQGYFELHFESFRMVTAGSSSSVWRIGFSFRLFSGVVRVFVRLLPWIGEDFFPAVDAGQIKLHLRVPRPSALKKRQRCVMTSNASSITKFLPTKLRRDRQHRASLQRVQPYLQHFSSHRPEDRTS